MRLSFDAFVLDVTDETLVRGGTRVALRGKAFAVLTVLAENAGQLVTRERLLDAVWPDASIHEQGLSVCVKEIRAALGDDPRAPRYLKTEHGRGYRFVADVTRIGDDRGADAARTTITHDEGVRAQARRGLGFVWSNGVPLDANIGLIDGAREIGRGPLGSFALEDPAVSRRHVRVTCVADRWRVEDCGSRNGSWVDGAALAASAVDARAGVLVRAGDTLFYLLDDLRPDTAGGLVLAQRRRLCALLGRASGTCELRGSFVERALLETDRAPLTDEGWEDLTRAACAAAGDVPVTAAFWPR